MSKNTKIFFFLLIIAVAGYYVYKRYPRVIYRMRTMDISCLKPDPVVQYFEYDTDPSNDSLIKRGLRGEQFRLLDRILDEEERNGGMRLNANTVKKLAREDRAVIEAYERWRRCIMLMRSENHVIYPSERRERQQRN